MCVRRILGRISRVPSSTCDKGMLLNFRAVRMRMRMRRIHYLAGGECILKWRGSVCESRNSHWSRVTPSAAFIAHLNVKLGRDARLENTVLGNGNELLCLVLKFAKVIILLKLRKQLFVFVTSVCKLKFRMPRKYLFWRHRSFPCQLSKQKFQSAMVSGRQPIAKRTPATDLKLINRPGT